MPDLTADERALLRAVIADPDADLPRLVYADYLDDRGRAGDADRANQIRRQVAAPSEAMTATAVVLPELPATGMVVLRRGFAEHLYLTLCQLVRHAADLFCRHPVRAVDLFDRRPQYSPEMFDPRPWYWDCRYDLATLVHDENAAHPFGSDGEDALIPSELAKLPDLPELLEDSTLAIAGLVTFATQDDAADWLSARCVRFGRRAAGFGG